MINYDQILKVQKEWGNAIVKIGSLKDDRVACRKFTSEFLDKLYAFDLCEVLFKPTKASKFQFRTDKKSALSYFIGGNPNFDEDKGFALTPWKEVIFENNLNMILEEKRAIVMGNYYFIDMNNNKTKVEYTFGYRFYKGELKIDLHHSSIPFNP